MQLIEVRIGRDLGDFLRERYDADGLSLRQIADELGVDVGSVSRWMDRLGIARRGPGYHRPNAA